MPLRLLEYASFTDWPAITSWLSRRDASEGNVEPLVTDILAQVRLGGDEVAQGQTKSGHHPAGTRKHAAFVPKSSPRIKPLDADCAA